MGMRLRHVHVHVHVCICTCTCVWALRFMVKRNCRGCMHTQYTRQVGWGVVCVHMINHTTASNTNVISSLHYTRYNVLRHPCNRQRIISWKPPLSCCKAVQLPILLWLIHASIIYMYTYSVQLWLSVLVVFLLQNLFKYPAHVHVHVARCMNLPPCTTWSPQRNWPGNWWADRWHRSHTTWSHL